MAKAKGTKRRAPTPRATKDEVVRMRISADDKRLLVAAAGRDGLDVSAWLRRLALQAAREHGGD
jgi:uncharacterized protein (DUF1778 family)